LPPRERCHCRASFLPYCCRLWCRIAVVGSAVVLGAAASIVAAAQGVLRLVLAYVKGLPREEAPYLELPLHHVFTVKPHTYTCEDASRNLLPAVLVEPDGQNAM